MRRQIETVLCIWRHREQSPLATLPLELVHRIIGWLYRGGRHELDQELDQEGQGPADGG